MIVTAIIKATNAQRERAEQLKRQQQQQQNRPQAAPKRDDRFRNEIDVFLEEIGKRRAGAAPSGGQSQQTIAQAMQAAAAVREAANEPPAEKPRSTVRRQPVPKRAAADAEAKPSRPHRRPGGDIASRKSVSAENLGSQVRDHLQQYLDPHRLEKQVQADIGNKVEQTVRSHLGKTMTHGTDVPEPDMSDKPHPVVALLRNAEGVRNAVIINEVLTRPKSLRKK